MINYNEYSNNKLEEKNEELLENVVEEKNEELLENVEAEEVILYATTPNNLNLRNHPTTNSEVITTLPKDTILTICSDRVFESYGVTFRKVSTEHGITGYVIDEYIEKLN